MMECLIQYHGGKYGPKEAPRGLEGAQLLQVGAEQDPGLIIFKILQEPRKILLLPLPLPSDLLGLPFYLSISFEIALCSFLKIKIWQNWLL